MICTQCSTGFEIADRDRAFYKKVSPTFNDKQALIPEPTLCPACRQQRRFAFRNERHLYRRKCDGSGKEIISMYPVGAPYKIYAQDVWWQGNWNPTEYGRDFNFNKPFFPQLAELQKVVPRIALLNVNSENSDYCNFTGDVKNSYLIFGSVYSEDCYYGSPYYSKNCVDTLVLRECELCYECIDCRKLYNCLYCQDCTGSNDLLYCFDLQGCSDCIGCAGLRNKKYCIFNQPLSKEQYLKQKKEIDLCDPAHHAMLVKKLEAIKQKTPRLFMLATGSEAVSGSHVFNSKNTFDSFFADRCQDCGYCAQVVDLKDCYDNNYTEENELCYEYLGMYATRNTSFSLFCRHTQETYYSDYCVNCDRIFGCTNLRDKKYCIFNKQYSKEKYEQMVGQIVGHMVKTGEWGQFFPIGMSPYAFNETVAQEYFPLEKAEVEKRGGRWKEGDQKEFQPQTVTVPQDIKKVPDSLCYEVLACETTGRNFRIIPQELAFYRRMGLPIPRKHPDERHCERINKRNPRQLWNRTCDQCKKPILTSYQPGGKEVVYCENCYLKEVY
ncbi:hypothetical protein HZA43_03180 [Candidatus Peregrinibacteria bacterium]|nr:hypothetical protein [Candidatus Peregrinibacteria bacterium]